jgi:hypothetical protein
MDADLDTLCTVVYCTADDLLPEARANARRRVTDAEIVTLCVARAIMSIPWGANTRSRGNLVLVDEPTEEIAPLDVRHDANLRDRRSSLGSQELKPSMRPLPVVVLHVCPQNPVQVPGAEDQLPVQTVGAQRLHPAL